MTPFQYLRRYGFHAAEDSPVGCRDYVGRAGVFQVRVRVPVAAYDSRPALWVGYTAGGPLVELPSRVRYSDGTQAVEDAAVLMRLFQSTHRG